VGRNKKTFSQVREAYSEGRHFYIFLNFVLFAAKLFFVEER